jgi:hypothetical protein
MAHTRQPPAILSHEQLYRRPDLSHVGKALRDLGFLDRRARAGKSERREHTDDRNDHQQLDEREAIPSRDFPGKHSHQALLLKILQPKKHAAAAIIAQVDGSGMA